MNIYLINKIQKDSHERRPHKASNNINHIISSWRHQRLRLLILFFWAHGFTQGVTTVTTEVIVKESLNWNRRKVHDDYDQEICSMVTRSTELVTYSFTAKSW